MKAIPEVVAACAVLACAFVLHSLYIDFTMRNAARVEVQRTVIIMNKLLTYVLEDIVYEGSAESITFAVIQERFRESVLVNELQGSGRVPSLINSARGPLGEPLSLQIRGNMIEIRSTVTTGYAEFIDAAKRGVFVQVPVAGKKAEKGECTVVYD